MKMRINAMTARSAAMVAGVVLAAVALTGCGDDDDTPQDAGSASTDTPAATSPSTPSESPTEISSAPPVSIETTCGLLFGGTDNPLDEALKLVTTEGSSMERSQLDSSGKALEDLRAITASAGPELRPHLTEVITQLESLLHELRETGSATTDTATIRSSGTEIANQCARVL